MGQIVISGRLGSIADLTTPSLLQNAAYKLGQIVELWDDLYKARSVYVYVKSAAALTQYQPYVLSYTGTSGAEVTTAAPFTLAAPGLQVVLPQVNFTSGYYGWVLIEGEGKTLMTSETYAVGDFLRGINAGAYLHVDGTSGATTYTVNSCAVCREAGSTAVARKVYLINRQAALNAS